MHVVPRFEEWDIISPYLPFLLNRHIRTLIRRRIKNAFALHGHAHEAQPGDVDAFIDAIFGLIQSGQDVVSMGRSVLRLERKEEKPGDLEQAAEILDRLSRALGRPLNRLAGWADYLRFTVGIIVSFWQPFVASLGCDAPFYSRALTYLPSYTYASGDHVSDTFALCKIAMREEVSVTPVVETIDDLLRLREDRRLKRFRQLLWQWADFLALGEERALLKIRKDIASANKELKKLEKWKAASEGWLFWVEVIAGLVPLLNYIMAVEIVARHSHMRHLEERSSWVGLWH